MAESEGINEIVNQVAIQTATALMIALRDMDVGPQPTHNTSQREPQRQKHSRQVLEKTSINWNAQDRYV